MPRYITRQLQGHILGVGCCSRREVLEDVTLFCICVSAHKSEQERESASIPQSGRAEGREGSARREVTWLPVAMLLVLNMAGFRLPRLDKLMPHL